LQKELIQLRAAIRDLSHDIGNLQQRMLLTEWLHAHGRSADGTRDSFPEEKSAPPRDRRKSIPEKRPDA
jgi:hypothetical protein